MFAPEVASHVTTLCKYAFDEEIVRRGLAYHGQGRVISSNALLHKDNLHVQASVRGSKPKPYIVEARIYRRKARVEIEAVCTCDFGFNCKHAVAAIADVFGKDGMKLFTARNDRITLDEPETSVEAPPEPLAGHLAGWLNGLQAPTATSMVAARPAAPLKTIIYCLDNHTYRGLQVQIMQCKRLRSGALGRASTSHSQQLDDDSPYPPEGLSILRELAGRGYKSDTYGLSGAFARQMLPRLLATGRCHWKDVRHDAPLRTGRARSATLEWETTANGAQKPAVKLVPAASVVLPLDPPMYIDTTSGECGTIESAHAPAVIRQWLAAPALPPQQSKALATRVRALGLPAPREVPVIVRRHVRPTPVLRLMHAQLKRAMYDYATRENVSELDLLRLELDYAGTRIAYFNQSDTIEAFREGRVERIPRHRALETAAFNEIARARPIEIDSLYSYGVPDEFMDDATYESIDEWMGFMTEVVPRLRKNGWIIEIDPAFRYQFAAIDDWYSQTTTDATANDWFSFELGIMVEGKPINLLPMIRSVLDQMQAIQAAGKKVDFIDLKLPDGRFVQLPAQRVLDIGKTLAELYDPDSLSDGRLKVSRLRAAELVDIPGMGQWKGDEELRTLANRLASYKGIARMEPPAGLNATLRPYQLDGVSWLQFLREYSFGGILADDMGLGKTVQVLAHLIVEKESGRANLPSLVVAPTTLMANWRAEAQRFAPGLRVHVSHGGDRKEHFERLADFDLIVTSYSLLTRDEEILKGQPFHMLILDEAQYVKNPNTKWAEICRTLSARHRLCMTGTPMENHLGELWSLMTFLSPGYLGTQKQFGRVYRSPIEKAGDTDRRKLLAQRVRPFILRRRKEEVALELPPKTEITRTVELDGSQRDLYETVRLAMHQRVQDEVAKRGMNRSHIIILDALLKLRQICCDPRLVKLETARKVRQSAKLEMLTDILPKMIDEGRRVLLFSQFTSMLDLIENALAKFEIPFVRLDGSTADRETPVRRFQALEVPLFLISLKAGGTGLNLTAADTVIHYDPWWNPAVEQQATDRAHRIGQDKPVFVYKLVTQGTVEEKIVAMQDRKRELVAGLLGEGASQNLQLSKADLDHLFDPIA